MTCSCVQYLLIPIKDKYFYFFFQVQSVQQIFCFAKTTTYYHTAWLKSRLLLHVLYISIYSASCASQLTRHGRSALWISKDEITISRQLEAVCETVVHPPTSRAAAPEPVPPAAAAITQISLSLPRVLFVHLCQTFSRRIKR